MDHLLERLHRADDRRARFVSVIALVGPEYSVMVRGECHGTIASTPTGQGGFGFDPIFVPNGYQKTFAELPKLVKSQISHRARALSAVKLLLNSIVLMKSKEP